MDSNAKGTVLVATYIVDKIGTEDTIAAICTFCTSTNAKNREGVVSYIYLQDFYVGLDKVYTDAEIEAGMLTDAFLAYIYEVAKEKHLEVFVEQKVYKLERREDGHGIYKVITETDFVRILVGQRKAG